MLPSVMLLLVLGMIFLLILLALCLLIRWILQEHRRQMESQREVALAQVNLASQMSAMLVSKDPMTYQAIRAMDPHSSTFEPDNEQYSIDDLLEMAERGDPRLTEEDYARIDAAQFGPGSLGPVPR